MIPSDLGYIELWAEESVEGDCGTEIRQDADVIAQVRDGGAGPGVVAGLWGGGENLAAFRRERQQTGGRHVGERHCNRVAGVTFNSGGTMVGGKVWGLRIGIQGQTHLIAFRDQKKHGDGLFGRLERSSSVH